MDGLPALLLGLVFVFLGMFLFAFAIHGYIKGKQALSWPSTNGIIISSTIEHNVDDLPSHDIVYEYYVSDIKHTGRNVSFTGTTTNVHKELKKYSKGSKVRVFYNPNNHEDAVLEVEKPPKVVIQIKAGILVFLLLGVYFILSWWL